MKRSVWQCIQMISSPATNYGSSLDHVCRCQKHSRSTLPHIWHLFVRPRLDNSVHSPLLNANGCHLFNWYSTCSVANYHIPCLKSALGSCDLCLRNHSCILAVYLIFVLFVHDVHVSYLLLCCNLFTARKQVALRNIQALLALNQLKCYLSCTHTCLRP